MESNIEQIYDVIIIGAGIAGSSAAYCLKRKKTALNLLVIEGRDRCGGNKTTFKKNDNNSLKKLISTRPHSNR
jgi:flavin-dependent dehydrogenase